MFVRFRSAVGALIPLGGSGAVAAVVLLASPLPAQTAAPVQRDTVAPAASRPAPTPVRSGRGSTVYRIRVDGVVEMGLAPYIARSLREAADAGAAAAILDIDTPGGRVDAAQQIAGSIADSEVPVYALVNRHALSAGAMIALATRGVYMVPGATLGAATPVTGEGQKASEKMVSVMRAEFRSLAQARGLDPLVAEAMVDEDIAIPGLVERGKLLTLTPTEAAQIGFASEVGSWEEMVQRLGLEEAAIVQTRANWAERVVRFLTHPLVAPFLLSIGFLGLIMEVKTPAFGLAGLAGVTSLGLFFGSHLIIGLAGWEVLILLGVGVILLLVEAFVLPGFGVAGVLGLGAVAASIVMSMIGSFPTVTDLLIAIHVLGASIMIVALVSWQLIRHLPADRRAQAVLHRMNMTRDEGYSSQPRRSDLLGAQGVALTDLRPSGTARFGSEQVDVVSIGPWVQAGTSIRIVRAEGYRHVVEPV